jgi:hypothetical protein
VENILSYRLARPCRICSGGGEGVFVVSSKVFLVIMTFQSAGFVVGDRVPSVTTSVCKSGLVTGKRPGPDRTRTC